MSVIAGGASVLIYAESGPGPAREQLLRAGRALRPLTGGNGRLPTPALPRAVLQKLRAAERAYARRGSVGAAARTLGISPERVRRRLRLARAVRSLPRVRAVRCG